MNRDRQIKKDWENKKFQAREEYAKNKPLLSGSRVHEQATDYVPKNDEELTDDMDEALDKVSE